jgi:peptidoglycan/LPS O-acetylase OafA/YrhL
VLVVLSHWHWAIAPAGAGWVALKALWSIGWCGVDLFFVLSGFLITGILLDTRDSPNYFRSFYARRALRIFPLYYVVLTGVLLCDALFGGAWSHYNLPLVTDRKFYFMFLNNWWALLKGTWHSNMIGHFWSLAVEEQFYLMWSLCVWLVPRKHLGRICIGAFVGVLALRIAWLWHAGPSHALIENTFTRMDTLLAGAGCALLVRRQEWLDAVAKWIKPVFALSILGLQAILLLTGEMITSGKYTQSIGFTLLAALFSALVLSAYRNSGGAALPMRILRSGPLSRIGRYSYGIYVYHVPLFLVSQHVLYSRFPVFDRNPWLGFGYVIGLAAATFLVAAASYEWMEKRFLACRVRFSAHDTNREGTEVAAPSTPAAA